MNKLFLEKRVLSSLTRFISGKIAAKLMSVGDKKQKQSSTKIMTRLIYVYNIQNTYYFNG